jgi:predicted ribosomally synthesized peptide with SipW-like signal peptide
LALNKKFAGIAGGITAIGATVALTAGTFSYFSDSKTVDAGTVDFGTLTLSTSHAASAHFAVPNAKPGTVVYNGTDNEGEDPALCFENSGSMMGVLQLSVVPKAGNSWQFNKYVKVEFVGYDTYPESKAILHGANSLEQYQAAGRVNAAQLEPSNGRSSDATTKCAQMIVSIDKDAPNELQAATGDFTIEATLVQQEENGIYPAS